MQSKVFPWNLFWGFKDFAISSTFTFSIFFKAIRFISIVVSENNYYDCFGEWWEQRINLISRSEETSGREESDLSGSCSCECDRAEAASSTPPPSDGQSFPDKSNFQNGELTREVYSSRPTYLVELKEEQELNHQVRKKSSVYIMTTQTFICQWASTCDKSDLFIVI